jgi:hypothetical protein
MGLGIVIGRHGRACTVGSGAAAYGFAGLAGVCAMLTAFEGHGLFELPVFTHLGLLFGANLATALAAGIVRLALTRVEAGWMRIGMARRGLVDRRDPDVDDGLRGRQARSAERHDRVAAQRLVHGGTAGSGVSGSMELSSIQALSMQKSCAQLPPLKPKPGTPQSFT